jgi:hypothetical protein
MKKDSPAFQAIAQTFNFFSHLIGSDPQKDALRGEDFFAA